MFISTIPRYKKKISYQNAMRMIVISDMYTKIHTNSHKYTYAHTHRQRHTHTYIHNLYSKPYMHQMHPSSTVLHLSSCTSIHIHTSVRAHIHTYTPHTPHKHLSYHMYRNAFACTSINPYIQIRNRLNSHTSIQQSILTKHEHTYIHCHEITDSV